MKAEEKTSSTTRSRGRSTTVVENKAQKPSSVRSRSNPGRRQRHPESDLTSPSRRSPDVRSKLSQEIMEMEISINDENMVRDRIANLLMERDRLKVELAVHESKSRARSVSVKSFERLRSKSDDLLATRDHLEDEIAKAVAINSVLVERLAGSERSNAYDTNCRLHEQKKLAIDEMYRIANDLIISRACVGGRCEVVEWECDTNTEILRMNHAKTVSRYREVELRLRKAALARRAQIFEAMRKVAAESFDVYDEQRVLLGNLATRWRALKLERLKEVDTEVPDDDVVDAAKRELTNLSAELLRLQFDVFNVRKKERELRYEGEVLDARKQAMDRLEKLRLMREGIRQRFLILQGEYNKMLMNQGIDEPEEMEALNAEFGKCDEEEQLQMRDEAQVELDMGERESEEMQQADHEIRTWMSDRGLACLKAQARQRAINKYLNATATTGKRVVSDIITRVASKCDAMNASVFEETELLRDLDVMLLGDDGHEIPFDARCLSIQNRISVIFGTGDRGGLNAIEQKLIDELGHLRRP